MGSDVVLRARSIGLTLACAGAFSVAQGQESDVFALGRLTVTAEREQDVVNDALITSQELWAFDRNTLDEAVKIIPGVTSNLDSNGRRNERDILVRGYGRWQVPLSIDGIRIYLPADNRLDFGRFLTQDLAEIQVQKGYVSVLDGPGGLGGAINLVTRKPAEAFEARGQYGASFDNDQSYAGWSGFASVGTKQDLYYAQLSGSYLDRDHWRVSDDFRATPIEDGGDRNRSSNRDWRINGKVGFTPNETDEYSLSFTSQSGAKGAPLNVYNNPPNPPNSYWDWPYWDIKNIYFLSNTDLGGSSYLKGRAFVNSFDNALWAYDDARYTTQSSNGRFRSVYADTGYGGSVEFGTTLFERNTLKAAAHYRRDEHVERNFNRPTSPLANVEPKQTNEEDTWSLAVENTFALSDALDLIAGLSYDKNDLRKAEEFNTTQGLFNYPTGGSDAVNAQAAVHWQYDESASLRGSISSRTRFPTIFERFSTRFGTARPNPDLATERGINYEIAWEGNVSERTNLSAAFFYNDVKDMIQTVVVVPGSAQITQAQNVGDGEYYGVELGGDTQVADQLRVGFSYTYMERDIKDALQPNIEATGTPTNQAFVFATYSPLEALSLTPSIEYADERWSDVTGGGYRKVVRTQSSICSSAIAFSTASRWRSAGTIC